MQQLTSNQRDDEWFEARTGVATASRFADIMAKGRNGNELAGRKNYRAQLVTERLTNNREEMRTSAAMDWGTDYEDVARLRYELKTGNSVTEGGFYKHDKLEAGASPDGFIDEDGLIEIKCPNTNTHIETLKRQDIPKQYYWQVMGQMWITGRQWCDFVSFDPRLPEQAQLFITRIDRDDNAIKMLVDEITGFLREVEAEVKFIENYKGGA